MPLIRSLLGRDPIVRIFANNEKHKAKTTPTDNCPADNATTTDAARKAVFDATELLEHILCFAPELDVLKWKAVCKHFKDTIEGSIKLQKRLFTVEDSSATWENPVYNHLAFEHSINPLEGTSRHAFRHDTLGRLYPWHESLAPGDSPRFRLLLPQSIRKINSAQASECSCYDMFLTQPPTKQVMLSICTERPPLELDRRYVFLRRAEGVRVGDVLQFFEHLAENVLTEVYELEMTKSWIEVRKGDEFPKMRSKVYEENEVALAYPQFWKVGSWEAMCRRNRSAV